LLSGTVSSTVARLSLGAVQVSRLFIFMLAGLTIIFWHYSSRKIIFTSGSKLQDFLTERWQVLKVSGQVARLSSVAPDYIWLDNYGRGGGGAKEGTSTSVLDPDP